MYGIPVIIPMWPAKFNVAAILQHLAVCHCPIFLPSWFSFCCLDAEKDLIFIASAVFIVECQCLTLFSIALPFLWRHYIFSILSSPIIGNKDVLMVITAVRRIVIYNRKVYKKPWPFFRPSQLCIEPPNIPICWCRVFETCIIISSYH